MDKIKNQTDPIRELSEGEIDFLELQIPSQAAAATQAAFWNTLTNGGKVVYAEGDDLFEISSDGSKRFIKPLEANISLPIATEIRVK